MKQLRVALCLAAGLLPASGSADAVELTGPDGTPRQWEIAADEWEIADGPARQLRLHRAPANPSAWRNAVREQGARPVLYPVGADRSPAHRRIATARVRVRLEPGANPAAIAIAAGLHVDRALPFAPGYWLFRAATPVDALASLSPLRQTPGVLSAEPLLGRQYNKRSATAPNDPLFGNQWHLKHLGTNSGITGLAGSDANVTNAWATVRGNGIVIGIVDDGLQTSHPDLSPRYVSSASFDWNGNDSDPSPNLSLDDHGTACAGVAAAAGDNGVGVCGAAYEASLAGLRLIGSGGLSPDDSDEADAMLWKTNVIDIKSNSWGPTDTGALDGGGPLALAALGEATRTGRSGLGTLFTWAGGNGGAVDDNSNYDSYANSRFVLAIGALNDEGKQSYYSEDGANLAVAAPSNDTGHGGIWTADLTGNDGYNSNSSSTPEPSDRNYTATFGGTSSATPLVAGVCALILNANPSLGWRDVHEILIRTATRTDPTDADWAVNGAGLWFNHKYGAGRVNAGAAVALATTWTNLPPATNRTFASPTNLNLAIPDNTPAGVTYPFDLNATAFRLERVTLTVNATHAFRGDLDIRLTAPSGKTSRLAERHGDAGANLSNWVYSSTHHWGENARGTWTVRVSDRAATDPGTLNALTLTLHGTPWPDTAPALVSATRSETPDLSNTNTFLDPGESARETVVFVNPTTSTVTGASAVLVNTNPAVTLLTDTIALPSLAPGARTTNANAVAYRVARSFTGTNLTFSLVTSAPGLPSLTNTLTRAVGRAVTLSSNIQAFAQSPARAIPEGNSSIRSGRLLVTNTINLAGNPVVDDVQVHVLATHANTDHLSLFISHPDGSTVRLARANTLGGANLGSGTNYTIFRDNGGSRVPFGSAPFSSNSGYVSMSELAPLNGKPANGNWTLAVADQRAGTNGTLSAWRLRLITRQQVWTNSPFNNPPLTYPTNAAVLNSLTATLPGYDPDGDPVTYAILTNATYGGFTAFNSTSGTFTYVPDVAFTGTDTVTFTVSSGSASATGVLTLVVALTDTDYDGLPNVWEDAFGFDSYLPGDATEDPDDDGQSNLAEYFADTHPRQANSVFRLASTARTGDVSVLSFASATNRNYRLQSTPRLDLTWTNVGPAFPGTGTNLTRSVTNPAPAAFYRLLVVP